MALNLLKNDKNLDENSWSWHSFLKSSGPTPVEWQESLFRDFQESEIPEALKTLGRGNAGYKKRSLVTHQWRPTKLTLILGFERILSTFERIVQKMRNPLKIKGFPEKSKALTIEVRALFLVRITGVEPAWCYPHGPEPCASANSAISACSLLNISII